MVEAGQAQTKSLEDPQQQRQQLKCICNLCDCGAHRCADFDWLNGTGGGEASSCVAPACAQHRAAAHEERYLSAASARAAARPPAPEEEPGARIEQDEEPMRVLVTRPEIAARPRDNIIFQGDMDLRTTFETSYEALARMRLEHWKQRQHELQAATDDKSATKENGGEAQRQVSERCNARGPARRERRHVISPQGRRQDQGQRRVDYPPPTPTMGRRTPDGPETTGSAHSQALTSARMIKSPARLRGGDSLAGTGLALNQRQHQRESAASYSPRGELISPTRASPKKDGPTAGNAAAAAPAPADAQRATPAGPATALAKPSQTPESNSGPLVDPDLSPIIVYDANLNRLERVGLRKRSKYRPSTSLRPGGRGFFGGEAGAEGDGGDQQAKDEPPARSHDQAGQHKLEKREIATDEETARQQQTASPSNFNLHDKAAGASSEILNRNKDAGENCGRKHHLGHVNRIDHIKQLNLVENTDPNFKEFCDKATLTDHELLRQLYKRSIDEEQQQQVAIGRSRASASATPLEGDLTAEERKLALEEEEAAVAEIQRVTKLDAAAAPDGQIAGPETTPQIAQAAVARSPLENAANSKSPSTNDRAQQNVSRQSRLQRVCQNQSFNIHENEYPEAKGGALSNIKIGGRETVDSMAGGGGGPSELDRHSRNSMTSPAQGTITPGLIARNERLAKNLFRESPDFILTTTGHRQTARKPPEEGPTSTPLSEHDQGQQALLSADERSESRGSRNNNTSREDSQQREELDHVGGLDGGSDEHFVAGQGASVEGKCLKCRVLDLGQDFEFVGSKSGHKYFVERHLEAPVTEYA